MIDFLVISTFFALLVACAIIVRRNEIKKENSDPHKHDKPKERSHCETGTIGGFQLVYMAVCFIANVFLLLMADSIGTTSTWLFLIFVVLNGILFLLYKVLHIGSIVVGTTVGAVYEVSKDEIKNYVNSNSDDASILREEMVSDPSNITAANNLVLNLVRSGRRHEAKVIIENLRSSTASSRSEFVYMTLQLAKIYADENNSQASLKLCDEVMAGSIPQYRKYAVEIAVDLCIKLEDYVRATRYLSTLGDEGAYEIACIYMTYLNDYDSAVVLLENISAKYSLDANVELGLARCYWHVKNKLLLEQQYAKVYKFDKKVAAEIYDMLAMFDNTSKYDSEQDKYYNILEIPIGSDFDAVKKGYKDLVKIWHPDRFESDYNLKMKATEKLKMINDAYSKLSSMVGL